MSRWDSAAMVANTSELLPEPETPVNTVSRRFGSSTLTSFRLLTRAPWTRIRSWRSAKCRARDSVSVFVAMLIVSPLLLRGPPWWAPPGRRARSNQLGAQRLVLLRCCPWHLGAWRDHCQRGSEG